MCVCVCAQMFPGTATVTLCPFSDPALHMEVTTKSSFWTNDSYYGLLCPQLDVAF